MPLEISALVLVDPEAARRAALAAALTAGGYTVAQTADVDPAADVVRRVGPRVAVLLAPGRQDRVGVALLRAAQPDAPLLAVARHDPATPSEGRDLLAAAQAAGCDGCLFYVDPADLLATLRACVTGVPCE